MFFSGTFFGIVIGLMIGVVIDIDNYLSTRIKRG